MRAELHNSETSNILLVEDNPADARYVAEVLPQGSYKLLHVSNLAEAQNIIGKTPVNLILLDLSLPDSTGLDTFTSISSIASKIPIIILTGLNDESFALEAVRSGAQDYIQKTNIEVGLLARSIRYAIERKQTEEKLRQSAQSAKETESNLKLALSASATGVWTWDLITDTIFVDDQCLSMFGLESPSQIRNLESFKHLLHPDDVGQVMQALDEAIDTHGEYFADFRVVNKEGNIINLGGRGRVLCDEDGKPIKITGVCRDITRQKLETEKDKRLTILEQHEDFMATLTHDLKNPLIGANRMLNMFVDGRLGTITQEQKDLLVQLRDSNTSLLDLIQNLIEVYRYEKDVSSVQFQGVDLCALAQKAINNASLYAKEKNIEIQLGHSSNIIRVSGHENSLLRVLQNLLDNAIKFSPNNAIINVNLQQSFGNAEVMVCDSGPGISDIDRNGLFQKFKQGEGGKKYSPGSGLGLYLCKQIVEAHHGEISHINNESGQGATFIFKLPSLIEKINGETTK